MNTENQPITDRSTMACGSERAFRVRLWDGDEFDESRNLAHSTQTGRQVLDQFDRVPADEYALLMWCRDGSLHTIELSEPVDLCQRGAERFFAFRTDRVFHWILNGQRLPWGAPTISEPLLRMIGQVPIGQALVLERRDMADQVLEEDDVINLDETGTERLITQPRAWSLNVQGVVIDSDSPQIRVDDALRAAGFDPSTGWIAILKTRGSPKQPVSLEDSIDLSAPGVERLRLTPKEIINGETSTALRRDFNLPTKDGAYLRSLTLDWEAVIDRGRRWLLVRALSMPNGLNVNAADLAIEIPATYPASGLDMFYCSPALVRQDGRRIAQTESQLVIDGMTYQRWSRHRSPATPWNADSDNLITHMALVEASLTIEGL